MVHKFILFKCGDSWVLKSRLKTVLNQVVALNLIW